ncbi:hypothetical protein Lalb_Chr06g0169621 [Lupinus albus]|uniref:RNase H type-1 domain-containing protein n=1 Tax=Lupinus albus TaxID=3870 RepID=A0A6A4QFX6_LUPAL|nr:hypothetical protein Lalb_Chr06g0169621 [Lupinus albus]
MAVDIFKGDSMVPWKLFNKWPNCKSTLVSMFWSIIHIYRGENVCADKLANFGVASKTYTWWNNLPNFIFEDHVRDKLSLPNFRFSA